MKSIVMKKCERCWLSEVSEMRAIRRTARRASLSMPACGARRLHIDGPAHRGRLRYRSGATLIEMVVSALILSFIVAATAGLYTVGQAQQRTARSYSEAQTDIRTTLRRMTRALRHGYQVVGVSAAGTLAGKASGPDQVIVRVPEPGGGSQSEILFYRSGSGVLYFQRESDAAPGTPLVEGVRALAVHYFRTDIAVGGAIRVPVDADPATATEAEVTLTVERPPAVTTVKAYVTLRNAIVGF